MKRRVLLLPMVMLVVILAAAGCTGAAEQTEPEAAGEMASDEMASDEMASDETSADEEMASDEESMEESSEEAMAEEQEEMASEEMASDEASADEMAEETEESMAEVTEEPMAMDEEAEATEEPMAEGGEEDEMMESDMSGLSLEFAGLEDLGEGWAYEGWLIVDGAPVSTGVFTVDSEGMASAHVFEVEPELLEAAELFVLTIEPAPDADPGPSQVHILAGAFEEDSAVLSIAHPAALGTDFSSAAGSSYILGIPTSNSASDSYTSGIWFDMINLPELPAGWVYEGWVVGMDGPVTTGRFASASEADDDAAGPTAGPNPGPSFPGQDFLDPAVFLTDGYAAVISVEPDPDNSPGPFTLKPLVDANIEDVGDHGSQELTYSADSFPT